MDLFNYLITNLEVTSIVPLIKQAQFLVSMLTIFFNNDVYYPAPAQVNDGQSFDFIIVGGGTAGCVLANRLTEANWTVLLIEAGGIPPITTNVPPMFPLLHHSKFDWKYVSVDDGYSSQAHPSRNLHLAQGKMLGGSSGMGFMIYVRGNKVDYDGWAASGNEGWSWNDVLPYFIKSENMNSQLILNSPSAILHGTRGPIGITKPLWGQQNEKYLRAFRENGHQTLIDYNGFTQMGYAEPEFTISQGVRQSTAQSYITPIKNRSNLYILYNSLVTKILINQFKSATGVEVLMQNGRRIQVYSRKEVIISAGAFNSPKLLMISGVGPRQQLEKYNINVIQDNENVGSNLHDSPMTLFSLYGAKNVFSKINNLDPIIRANTFPGPAILGFAALNNAQTYPDYEIPSLSLPPGSLLSIVLCKFIFRQPDNVCDDTVHQMREAYYGGNLLMHPKSRGWVELQSRDPQVPPAIYSGYYSEPEDLERTAQNLADFVSVINTTYFQQVNGEVVVLLSRYNDFLSQNYWKCLALNIAETLYSFAGTCAMAPGDGGVVDNNLKVKGIEKLRIIDSSIIPTPISGNTYAAVVMIAEKMSDIIKADYGMRDIFMY